MNAAASSPLWSFDNMIIPIIVAVGIGLLIIMLLFFFKVHGERIKTDVSKQAPVVVKDIPVPKLDRTKPYTVIKPVKKQHSLLPTVSIFVGGVAIGFGLSMMFVALNGIPKEGTLLTGGVCSLAGVIIFLLGLLVKAVNSDERSNYTDNREESRDNQALPNPKRRSAKRNDVHTSEEATQLTEMAGSGTEQNPGSAGNKGT